MINTSQIKEHLTDKEMEAARALIKTETEGMSQEEIAAFLKGIHLVWGLISYTSRETGIIGTSALVAAAQEKCGID